jgi:hypothetical protein
MSRIKAAFFSIGLVLGIGFALFLFGTLISRVAHAADSYHIIDLNELTLDYRNFAVLNPNARNMLIYPEPPKEGINVGMKVDVLTYLYWDSQIEALTTDAQYRAIGLETRLGVRVSHYLEIGYLHHSQHLIDRDHAYMNKYPVEDSIQVKLYLYRAKGEREPLF